MENSLPTKNAADRWWRFSLRELLLLMLAIGALLGWLTTVWLGWRFSPTQFYGTDETWQEVVAATHKELGETGFDTAWIYAVRRNGSLGESRTMFIRVPLSPQNKTRFLDALERHVTEKLKASGCETAGGSFGNGNKKDRVILYERGPIVGGFEAYMRDIDDDHVDLILHMYEQRGRPFSTGIRSGL